MGDSNITEWSTEQVINWAIRENLNSVILNFIKCENIDGKCLLSLNENDLKCVKCNECNLKLGDIKNFWISIRNLHRNNHASLVYLGLAADPVSVMPVYSNSSHTSEHFNTHFNELTNRPDSSPPLSIDGRATILQPEFFKTMISLGEIYFFLQYVYK